MGVYSEAGVGCLGGLGWIVIKLLGGGFLDETGRESCGGKKISIFLIF